MGFFEGQKAEIYSKNRGLQQKNVIFPFTLQSRCAIINSLKAYYLTWRYIMAHVISDECVMCGACAATCPVSAISEGDTKYVVDADVCIDCGACEDGCPTGAIKAAD